MQKEQFYNLLDNTNLLNQETLTELKELTEKYPYFQSARLLYLKNLQNTGASDFESELKKAAPLVADRKQLYRILNPEKRKKSGNTNFENQTSASSGYIIEDSGKSVSGNSLIDKFLSAQPGPMKIGKISREKHLEDSENEIIAKSVAENDELVTETLATIYFEQKKYDKALEAFQKLSLKYPEKNVYFATRIEEIEKLKNI